MNSLLKKPSKPHIMNTQTELTDFELARREFVENQLSELGISTTMFDGDVHEDADVLKAMILVNQGLLIPDDLKQRVIEKRVI